MNFPFYILFIKMRFSQTIYLFKYVIFVPKGARRAYIDNLSVVKVSMNFFLITNANIK